nr:uncharacterized protein LOC117861636 isoform X1 [Setaria viridis]
MQTNHDPLWISCRDGCCRRSSRSGGYSSSDIAGVRLLAFLGVGAPNSPSRSPGYVHGLRAGSHLWYPPPVQVVGIDLRNTNSCIAGYAPAKTDTMFQFCIPSWVAFTDDGATLVGEAASNHAGADPEAVIFGFKRLLGLSTAAGLEHEVQPEQHSRVRMAWKNPRRFRRLEGLQSLR